MKIALIDYAAPIVTLGQTLAHEHDLTFGGIDLSPAPMGEDSIVSALELCGYGKIGSPGTVAVAAALTHALKHSGLPTCGYCGLMLPVLEDAVLGRRWAEGQLSAHQLLLYSAICGTGLDTLAASREHAGRRNSPSIVGCSYLSGAIKQTTFCPSLPCSWQKRRGLHGVYFTILDEHTCEVKD